MNTKKLIVLSEISESEKQLVKSQLEKILASTYFGSAKQMQRFLEYVVEKTIAGEGKLLKQYTIGVEAFDYPDDFDSDSNPVVRILAGRVRKRLKDYYKNTDNNVIVICIPKGTYTPILKYPIKKSLSSSKKDDFAASDFYLSTGPRLALLGFTDKTQDEMSNRLLLQTTDALAAQLSRFITFNLSVYNPFDDKSKSQGIGEAIDADYFLALYVQGLAAQKFELVCRLNSVKPEETLWSESYSFKGNLESIDQNDMLGKITAMVADTHQGRLHTHWARKLLLNKETIPPESKVLAYYQQYYDNFNLEALAEATSVCEAALEKTPHDILANIVFTDLCRRDYVNSYEHIESSLIRGIECAERVIHLRYDMSEAHYALGQLLFCQGEWARSKEELRIARDIFHTPGVIEYGCGFHLCLMNEWEEGLELVHTAMSTSKSYPSWYRMPVFLDLYFQGKYEEALLEAEKIVVPRMPYGPLARCIASAQLGKIAKAKKELQVLGGMIPDMGGNGKMKLQRMFGNEELTDKIWEGLMLAIKG